MVTSEVGLGRPCSYPQAFSEGLLFGHPSFGALCQSQPPRCGKPQSQEKATCPCSYWQSQWRLAFESFQLDPRHIRKEACRSFQLPNEFCSWGPRHHETETIYPYSVLSEFLTPSIREHNKVAIKLMRVFPGGTNGKGSTCQCRRQKRQVWSLGQEDALEEEVATHSSILAWKIPWTEEPGWLQSIGSHRVETKGSFQLKIYIVY